MQEKFGIAVVTALLASPFARKRFRDGYGGAAATPLFALVRCPIDLRSNDADLNALLTLVRDAEKEKGEKCVWLIVDTLSRAMAGGDENSPVDMGLIVAAADRFRAETGAHFTYVHHTARTRRGVRGDIRHYGPRPTPSWKLRPTAWR